MEESIKKKKNTVCKSDLNNASKPSAEKIRLPMDPRPSGLGRDSTH
jgi:hypothetical protein